MTKYGPVAAEPYVWPYDGSLDSSTTAGVVPGPGIGETIQAIRKD